MELVESSLFDKQRRSYRPRYPSILENIWQLSCDEKAVRNVPRPAEHCALIKKEFPISFTQKSLYLKGDLKVSLQKEGFTVGVVLSGGQAPGGHNVICGMFDALKCGEGRNKLIGFRMGPSGILKNDFMPITKEMTDYHLNTGGFDMLGSGRSKLETDADFATCVEVMRKHNMQTLVIIGGDDSNTNAAVMSEYLAKNGHKDLSIIGVPKTIDGDLQNEYLQTSFGFDTAVKLYAELVSNICRDALSAKKYYHFIRLMGRAASHITFDVALATHPNITLLSEEIFHQQKTLRDIVKEMAQIVIERSKAGKNYGVILVPEGLIEYIPEFTSLISEINDIFGQHSKHIETLKDFGTKSEYINQKLGNETSHTLSSLPMSIQRQILSERDPHGNVQVSRIETEKLIIEMLSHYLQEQKSEGDYRGKFAYQSHFLGYEGRCASPTNFDANYAYSLGRTAAALVVQRSNGYMAVVNNLDKPVEQWRALGVPLVAMMNIETRRAKFTPVIKKSLVRLSGPAYDFLVKCRDQWAYKDDYRNAGAIQYFGPSELCDSAPLSLVLDNE